MVVDCIWLLRQSGSRHSRGYWSIFLDFSLFTQSTLCRYIVFLLLLTSVHLLVNGPIVIFRGQVDFSGCVKLHPQSTDSSTIQQKSGIGAISDILMKKDAKSIQNMILEESCFNLTFQKSVHFAQCIFIQIANETQIIPPILHFVFLSILRTV